MNKAFTRGASALAMALVLMGCDRDNSDLLVGPREPIRASEPNFGVQPPEIVAAKELRLPRARNLTEWTHGGGAPDHNPDHATLAETVSLAWSADIGEGNDRRHRITAQPVADKGRIFTLDSVGLVSAVSEAGAVLWQTDLAPKREPSDASGGGMATDGDTLFVSSAFGVLTALDVTTGAVKWRQDLDAAGTTAPTVAGGIVYLVAGDNRAWAIDANTGRINWTVTGVSPEHSVAGGGAPALSQSLAVFPFSTGDVQAVFRRGGFSRWNASISGGRDGFAISAVTDILADPVIDNGRVYVGNFAGRLAALDAGTGDRLWTTKQGVTGAIVPVGSSDIFTLSDRNQLLRISAKDGSVVWARQLAMYLSDNPKRWDEVEVHFGPLLAGGRLVVASGDGLLRSFRVTDGALLSAVAMPAGASALPIVVNETVYVVSDKGTLLAFR